MAVSIGAGLLHRLCRGHRGPCMAVSILPRIVSSSALVSRILYIEPNPKWLHVTLHDLGEALNCARLRPPTLCFGRESCATNLEFLFALARFAVATDAENAL